MQEIEANHLGVEFAAVAKMTLILGAALKKAGAKPEVAAAVVDRVSPVLENLVRAPGEKLVVVGLDQGNPMIASGDDHAALQGFVDILTARDAVIVGLNPGVALAEAAEAVGGGHARH